MFLHLKNAIFKLATPDSEEFWHGRQAIQTEAVQLFTQNLLFFLVLSNKYLKIIFTINKKIKNKNKILQDIYYNFFFVLKS